MITIQGFAKLCGCNTQTLRYYDRIGLLTPARVDEWSGYRYYEEDQALLFVKIKNLQQADFSIEEIRSLLNEDEDHLMAAFDRKIAQQTRKLERIREIQRSYLSDRMEMQEMISMLTGLVVARADDPRLLSELGLDDEQGAAIAAKARELLAGWLTECRDIDAQTAANVSSEDLKAVPDHYSGSSEDVKELNIAVSGPEGESAVPDDAYPIFEQSGWQHVSEWIRDLPDPGSGKQTFFCFRVRKDSAVNDPGFPTLMLAVIASSHEWIESGISCNISLSEDGLNHFSMLLK